MNKQVRKNIFTDLCQEQETINFKERTVNDTKQHTMQVSQTKETHLNKKTQNMSTSLKYNNYILINNYNLINCLINLIKYYN